MTSNVSRTASHKNRAVNQTWSRGHTTRSKDYYRWNHIERAGTSYLAPPDTQAETKALLDIVRACTREPPGFGSDRTRIANRDTESPTTTTMSQPPSPYSPTQDRKERGLERDSHSNTGMVQA